MGMNRALVALALVSCILIVAPRLTHAADPLAPNAPAPVPGGGGVSPYTGIDRSVFQTSVMDEVKVRATGTPRYKFKGCSEDDWKALNEHARRAALSRRSKFSASVAHGRQESTFSFANGSGLPCTDIALSFSQIGIFIDPAAWGQSLLSNFCTVLETELKKRWEQIRVTKVGKAMEPIVTTAGSIIFEPARYFYAGIEYLEAETGVALQRVPGLQFYTHDGLLPEINGDPVWLDYNPNSIPVPSRATIILPEVRVGNYVVPVWPRSLTCESGKDCVPR